MKLSDIMEQAKTTLSTSGASGGLPRNEAACTFQPSDGYEGVFPEPFVITLRELTADQELAALRGAKSDPLVAAFIQAKAAIALFNGEKVGKVQREFIYNNLTTKGRARLVEAFAILVGSGSESEDAAGDTEGKGE